MGLLQCRDGGVQRKAPSTGFISGWTPRQAREPTDGCWLHMVLRGRRTPPRQVKPPVTAVFLESVLANDASGAASVYHCPV